MRAMLGLDEMAWAGSGAAPIPVEVLVFLAGLGVNVLEVTDRKKELIITSSGKNVSPAQIENMLRAHPLIGQAVAIGDRRPYVTALIVLDEEAAPVWAAAQGLPGTTVAELAEDPTVRAAIAGAVAAANEKLARPEQIKTFHVMPSGWTPETGELTPSLKLRRRIIADRYAAIIEGMYAS